MTNETSSPRRLGLGVRTLRGGLVGLSLLCAAAGLATPSHAQPDPGTVPDSPDEPAGPAPSESEDAERRVPRVPGEVESFAPVEPDERSPIRPGLTEGASWETLLRGDEPDEGPVVLPERTFLNRLRGEVVAGPHGTRIFGYNDPNGLGRGAMLLLPCAELDRFDEFAFGRNERVPALVSGQVFVYDGQNYLLPNAIRAASSATATDTNGDAADQEAGDDGAGSADASEPIADGSPTNEAGDGEGNTSTAPASSGPTDPVAPDEVDSLIESLERRPVYNRRRSRGGAAGEAAERQDAAEDESAGAEGGTASPSIPDGNYIREMRGRMVRSVEGNWVFVGDGEDMDGFALTMLPCRMLQRLEGVALREGDDTAVTVSGRVYTFRGDRYLLPTLFQRERREGVDPLQ